PDGGGIDAAEALGISGRLHCLAQDGGQAGKQLGFALLGIAGFFRVVVISHGLAPRTSFRGGPAGPNPESRGSPMRSAHLRFALRAPRNDGALCYSQPSLAPLEAFQILEALALVAGAAEIELLDVLIVAQLVRGAVEH